MTSPLFNSANKLKLGTFSANCSGGMAVTKVEERWDNNWDNNIDLVQQCDEAGIEFMLPIAPMALGWSPWWDHTGGPVTLSQK